MLKPEHQIMVVLSFPYEFRPECSYIYSGQSAGAAPLQRLAWIESPDQPLNPDFKLTTTACSVYIRPRLIEQ